ncbi:MAG: hypothetical protein IJ816_02715 [Alloprevotella sp.]|nr:hypothetical protein [Alloprevotella sp.]
MFNRLLRTLTYAFVLSLGLISCNSEDYTSETGYDNCVVTSATLGTLKRTMHTTVTDDNGTTRDSTYIGTLVGSAYPLSIDQASGHIFNLDSLPFETDLTKVTFSNFTASSSVLIRKLGLDEDTIFTSTDSTDCSVVRQLSVYSPSYRAVRHYLLDLHVHKEVGDTFRWTKLAENVTALANLTDQRTLIRDNQIFLFAKENSVDPVLLSAPTSDASNLQRSTLSLASIETHNVVLYQNNFYALSAGQLAESTDGINWSLVSTSYPDNLDMLICAGSDRLVARAGNKLLSSKDLGQTWEEESLETGGTLPEEETYGLNFSSATNSDYEDLIIVGYNGSEPSIWKQNVDLTGFDQFPWNYYSLATDEATRLPQLHSTSLFPYDKGMLMLGLDSTNKLSKFYLSNDGGLHWSSTVIPQPQYADSTTGYTAAVDAQHFIYLFCNGSGEVFRGRLNRLGWTTPQYRFEE